MACVAKTVIACEFEYAIHQCGELDVLLFGYHRMPTRTVNPDVTPDAPLDEQPAIGLIGMGAMGTMYAKYLSAGGWKKYV